MTTPTLLAMKPLYRSGGDSRHSARTMINADDSSDKKRLKRLDETKRGMTNWCRLEEMANKHWQPYDPVRILQDTKHKNFLLKPLEPLPSKIVSISSKVLERDRKNEAKDIPIVGSSTGPSGRISIAESERRDQLAPLMFDNGRTTILESDTFYNNFALYDPFEQRKIKKRIKRFCSTKDHNTVTDTINGMADYTGRISQPKSARSVSSSKSIKRDISYRNKNTSKVSRHFQSNNGTIRVIKPIKLDPIESGKRMRKDREAVPIDFDALKREKTNIMLASIHHLLHPERASQPLIDHNVGLTTDNGTDISLAGSTSRISDFNEYQHLFGLQDDGPDEDDDEVFKFYIDFQDYLRNLPYMDEDVFAKCHKWCDTFERPDSPFTIFE